MAQNTASISSPIQIWNSDLVLGKDIRDNNGFYEGSMDNINIYSFALSPTQIQNIYSSYSGDYSVLLYYTFSDSTVSGSQVADMATGSAIVDAYLQNNATVSNNQLVLSASGSQYMSINSFATGSNGLTISCWFTSYNSGSWARLFEFGNGPTFDNVYISVNPGYKNVLALYVFFGQTACSFVLKENFNDGKGYYIAWTLSPAGSWVLYINGVLNTTISQTSCSNYGYPAAITRQWNFLGKSNWGTDDYLNGNIWDFRLYNYVLSATEIEYLFSFKEPTLQPTFEPTFQPTFEPTFQPTLEPVPSPVPSLVPTFEPTLEQTFQPSQESEPSPVPSPDPTFEPSKMPTFPLTYSPSFSSIKNFFDVGIYNFTIPAGIYFIQVTAAGASGGSSNTICGGIGAVAQAYLKVVPGRIYTVIVGGSGGTRYGNSNSFFPGGYNNVMSKSGLNGGAGGGGGSELRTASGTRLVVAGGGGGGFSIDQSQCGTASTGGNGGIPSGFAAVGVCSFTCSYARTATGGNQTSGGLGGSRPSPCSPKYSGANGNFHFGGNGDPKYGGSGGGGYYGGGGGGGTGGGGGSSYCSNSVCSSLSYSLNLECRNGETIGSCCIANGFVSVAYNPGPTSQPSSDPSSQPSKLPVNYPTSQPVTIPTRFPSKQPISSPLRHPSSQPRSKPTSQPSVQPSLEPNHIPSSQPFVKPSRHPSRKPTLRPRPSPSMQPSMQPSARPSHPSCQPTQRPSYQPMHRPSKHPTKQPDSHPTQQPSFRPSKQPLLIPSQQPVKNPSSRPSYQPSSQPHGRPTSQPFICPSKFPRSAPTRRPTLQPSHQPLCFPSSIPSQWPSLKPSNQPRAVPSSQPIPAPTFIPSGNPSTVPSWQLSYFPTLLPTCFPSQFPSVIPSLQPKRYPTYQPSHCPSTQPFVRPSIQPEKRPTSQPNGQPSRNPTINPSLQPIITPNAVPSLKPSRFPSNQPVHLPSRSPSEVPKGFPTHQPNNQPTSTPSILPSILPTSQPWNYPTISPSQLPSYNPTNLPTRKPSSIPFSFPSCRPTLQPTRKPSFVPCTQPSRCPSRTPTALPISSPSYRPTFQPLRYPSMQPYKHPSDQPSTSPTTQPLLLPSIKPSHQPTRKPSWQPISAPSQQPKFRPSKQPSRYPSRVPSMRPSKQPSCQPLRIPSLQPRADPSYQPTTVPILHPSRLPSRQPLRRPSKIPTRQPLLHPSYQPSEQPLLLPSTSPSQDPSRQPSCQPANKPTSQPTRQPSFQPTNSPSLCPTTSPSSRPTIDGIKCSHSTYYQPANNSCLQCPLNSRYYPQNRRTCGCNPGYSQSGFAGTLRCKLCSGGTYATNYSTVCIACPPGSFSAMAGSGGFQPCPIGYYASESGSTSCTPCPVGFYSSLLGQVSCIACSGGQITPSLASISAEFCLSPLPNFSMGFVALALAIFIVSKYILYGNYNRIAFFRRERYVIPLAKICKATNDILKKTIRQKREHNIIRLYSWIKVLLFLLVSMVWICMYSVIYFIGLLYSIFFASLILWRSLNVSFGLSPLLTIMSDALIKLAQSLGLPEWLLYYLLYPGIRIIEFLSIFQLNLAGLNVTCNGAKAPIELLFNCFILAIYFIFLASEYFLLWNVSFQGLNQAFSDLKTAEYFGNFKKLWQDYHGHALKLSYVLRNISVITFSQSISNVSKELWFILVVCPVQLFLIFPISALLKLCPFLVVVGIFATNPLQSLLKYSFTFANLSNFIADNGLHPLSPACDNVAGAPMFDTILGMTSSILAWLLVIPVIYLLSEVLVPTPAKCGDTTSDASPMTGDAERNATADEVTPRASANTTSNRLFIYLQNMVDSSLSIDIWIINGFASFWAKYLQKKFREKKRVRSNMTINSIQLFQQKAKIRTSIVHFKSLMATMNYNVSHTVEVDNQLLSQWAEVKRNKLPPYAHLCRVVNEELKSNFEKCDFPLPYPIIASILSYSGVGHVLVGKGRHYWGIVGNKYWIFAQICCGVWTNEAVKAFEIERIMKSMLTLEEDQALITVLGSIVSPRALLFLALNYGALLTALIISSCATPLFMVSNDLKEMIGKDSFPELLYPFARASAIAVRREEEENGESDFGSEIYYWVIVLKALVIVGTESLLVGFIKNMIIFAIGLIFLFTGGAAVDVIIVLFVLLVPYAAVSSFKFIIVFGKMIDLKDSDFKYVLCLSFLNRFQSTKVSDVPTNSNRTADPQDGVVSTANNDIVPAVASGVDSDHSSIFSSIVSSFEEKSSNELNSSKSKSKSKSSSRTSKSVHMNNSDYDISSSEGVKSSIHDISIAFSDESDRDDPFTDINNDDHSSLGASVAMHCGDYPLDLVVVNSNYDSEYDTPSDLPSSAFNSISSHDAD